MKRSCPCCGSCDVIALPVPHHERSMLSSGKLVERSLKKAVCRECEYGFHLHPLTEKDIAQFYDTEYTLGLYDSTADEERANAYAGIIRDVAGDCSPRTILDIGCGTGALLAALGQSDAVERLVGVEASEKLVGRAEQRLSRLPQDTQVVKALAEHFSGAESFELIVTVNVIEHSLDPLAFLQAIARHLSESGIAVVITPSGKGNEELLFLDHVSTFSPRALMSFGHGAGLHTRNWQELAGPASGFQLIVLEKRETEATFPSLPSQIDGRVAELEKWQQLNKKVGADFFQDRFAVFGAGQFTDLLATYAPMVFDKCQAVVVDQPLADIYRGKPCLRTDFAGVLNLTHLLLGVHPRSEDKVRKYLMAKGFVTMATDEVVSMVVAARYGVTQQLRSADETERAHEELTARGFTVISAGFSEPELDALSRDFEQAKHNYVTTFGAETLAAAGEPDTIRLMLKWDPAFRNLATNPALIALLRKVMPDYFILNQSNGLINRPKQDYSQAQYHRDLPYQHFTSSRPLAVNALYCVDDFTAENGATKVIPGSHLTIPFPSDRYIKQHEFTVEAPRGSFLVLDAMTYHSGDENRSERERRAVNHVYTIPMIRQQIAISRELGDLDLSEEERKLFGFGLEEPISLTEFLSKQTNKRKKKG